MAVIDDILLDLWNAHIFSTFDAKNGFWHMQLDSSSSYLTTFNTPFGRYHWLRMPFGIKSVSEVFQRHVYQAFGGPTQLQERS